MGASFTLRAFIWAIVIVGLLGPVSSKIYDILATPIISYSIDSNLGCSVFYLDDLSLNITFISLSLEAFPEICFDLVFDSSSDLFLLDLIFGSTYLCCTLSL